MLQVNCHYCDGNGYTTKLYFIREICKECEGTGKRMVVTNKPPEPSPAIQKG